MMKKLLSLIMVVLCCAGLAAQNKMNEINRIKRDKGYLYGEATLDTKEAALSLAYELLEAEIKNWAKEKSNKISSVVALHTNDYADTIILPRHNMIRAFAYVKISNLNPIKGKALKVDVDGNKNAVAEASLPAKEVAKKSKGKSKKAKEAPKKANDVAKEIAEQPKKTLDQPKKLTAPAKEVSEPVKKELVAAPKAEKVEVPTVKSAAKVEANHDYAKEVVDELRKVTSFYNLESAIKPLHEQGKITGYGKYSTMTDPAASYLIIYDSNANVRAILGKGTTVRKNLSTGKDDSEKNYKGCGALWFKVKE